MQFTPTVNKVLNDLKLAYPEQGEVLDSLCHLCFALGERQEIINRLNQLDRKSNPTIPEEANLYAEMTSEVL